MIGPAFFRGISQFRIYSKDIQKLTISRHIIKGPMGCNNFPLRYPATFPDINKSGD